MRLIRDREDKTVTTQRDADRRIGERLGDEVQWMQNSDVNNIFTTTMLYVVGSLEAGAADRAGAEHQLHAPAGDQQEEPGEGAGRDGGAHEGQLGVHLQQVTRHQPDGALTCYDATTPGRGGRR